MNRILIIPEKIKFDKRLFFFYSIWDVFSITNFPDSFTEDAEDETVEFDSYILATDWHTPKVNWLFEETTQLLFIKFFIFLSFIAFQFD